MSNFLVLLEKIYPLYIIIGFGIIAGKYLHVQRDSIAKIVIYVVAPVVVFNSFATMPAGNSYLLLPFAFFASASFISFLFYFVGKSLDSPQERNLLAAGVGSANTGYFGIPLVLAVFGERYLNIAVISTLGLIVYENTIAYFLISRSHHTIKQSFLKMATLPSIYACFAGIFVNKMNWTIPTNIENNITYFRGSYVVLGMMVIGIALSSVVKSSFDLKFGVLAFTAKFVIYPIVVGLLVYLDANFFHLYGDQVHKVLLVLSAVPMAANIVAFASHLKVHPEKMAAIVFASTLFALVYLPIFISVVVY